MDFLSIDFETRSDCDLIARGIYNYASDLSTEVLMMGWAFGDEPAVVWLPDEPFPQRIIDHIKAGGEIRAWNAQFERLVWAYVLANDYDLPNPGLRQWKCTAARARAHGLPGSLKDAARALNLPMQKQEAGVRLIRQYCVPGHEPSIPEGDMALFTDYCRLDVEVERQIGQVLRELTDIEWEDYWVNEEINDRGVPLDVAFARKAVDYGAAVRADADKRIKATTKGSVHNARSRKERDEWLLPRLTSEQLALITEKEKVTFDKAHREALLQAPDLDEDVAEFINAVEEAGGATISKYSAFADRAVDGRLCGAFMFSGGGQTGRYSSVGVQLQNLRRDVFDAPQEMIDMVMEGKPLPEPSKSLSRLIRACIYLPEGMSWVDYSNIEGRVAPWLSNTPEGEAKLDVFRKGLDPYKINAARVFNTTYDAVTKQQRQAGKVQELALGFLGGVGALKVMGKSYGLVISDDYGKELRDAWREVNPWAMAFGMELEKAAMRAVRSPGEWFEAGRVAYAFDGHDWLWCRLPSGRLLAYFAPQLEEVQTPWGDWKLAVTVLWGAGRPKVGADWPRRAVTPGLLLENITQATAACLLRDALRRLAADGVKVVAHVHDEVVAEGIDPQALAAYLTTAPTWAKGLPVEVSAEHGARYGK